MSEKIKSLADSFKEVYDNLEKADLLQKNIKQDNFFGKETIKTFSHVLNGIEMFIFQKHTKGYSSILGESISFTFRTPKENLFKMICTEGNDSSLKLMLDLDMNEWFDIKDYSKSTHNETIYQPLLEAVNLQERFDSLNQQALVIIKEQELIIKEQELQALEKQQNKDKEKEAMINDSINKIKQMREPFNTQNNSYKNN